MRGALKDGLQCTEGPVRVLAVRQSFVKEEHLEGCMRQEQSKIIMEMGLHVHIYIYKH